MRVEGDEIFILKLYDQKRTNVEVEIHDALGTTVVFIADDDGNGKCIIFNTLYTHTTSTCTHVYYYATLCAI